MFRSLRVKFVLYFVGFTTATVVLLAKSLFDHEHEALLSEMQKRLAVESVTLAIQSQEAMETNDDLSILATLRGRRATENFEYGAVLYPDGTVFAHSDVKLVGRLFEVPEQARELRKGFAYRTLDDDTHPAIEVWTPVQSTLGGSPERIGLVCLALSQEPLLHAVRSARMAAIRVGGFFLLLGVIGTALITRTVTKPIDQLVHGVRRIAAGDLAHKMRLRRADEIGMLAESFDAMTDELQRAQQELLSKQLYEKELEVAGKIQAALLPRGAPHLPGCSVSALSVPARVVGGDFYDYMQLRDGRTAFLVADVAGKGVSAGLVMTAVRSAARSVFSYTVSPHEALVALNEQMLRDFERKTFVTMLAMVLDRSGRRLCIANGGHPPVLRVRGADGENELLSMRGAAIGVLPGSQFRTVLEEIEIDLEPGDLILGYSDGVNEARAPSGDLFGEARLQQFARRHATLEPQEFLQRLHAELVTFALDAGQSDDITVLALKAATVRSPVLEAPVVQVVA